MILVFEDAHHDTTPDYVMSNMEVRELYASAVFGLKGERLTPEMYLSSFNTGIGILRSSHTEFIGPGKLEFVISSHGMRRTSPI